MEEFCPDFFYKPGKEHIVAEFFPQHPKLGEVKINKLMYL
jgi:hypothetical protein